MEINSQHKKNLLHQVKESYGRIVYTYTCHNKMIARLEKTNQRISVARIILSALSSTGFIATLINDEYWFKIAGGISSTVLLGITLYFKDFSLVDEIESHRKAVDELWLIKEKYISLMTDFDILPFQEIMTERKILQEKTYKIYSCSPKTDRKSYVEAQKALKVEEEQFFTTNELNEILPSHLRDEKNEK